MASKPEIMDCIEALAVHCRPPLMSVEQRALWMGDWCNDLGQYPADAIAKACQKWRHGENTKFPTVGQLLPFVKLYIPAAKGERVEVWRELSDAEYGALSVREKIRHRTILAHEARTKAGPMWKSPPAGGNIKKPVRGHIDLADMPDIYRRWTAIAEGHEAEIKRLREIIREPMPAE